MPNVHLLRRRPNLLRYILIFQTDTGAKIAATYRHAEKVITMNTIERSWLIDIKQEKMRSLSFADLSRFMSEWRGNYLNPDWTY